MICWWEQLADLLGQLYNFTICSDSDRRFDSCGRCSCQLAQFNKHHGIEIPNLETMVQKWRPHTLQLFWRKSSIISTAEICFLKCNKTYACLILYLNFSLPHFKTKSSPIPRSMFIKFGTIIYSIATILSLLNILLCSRCT